MLAAAFYEDPLTLFAIGLVLLILFFWYFATEIERRKRDVGTVLTIGICALSIMAITPIKDRLKGGIDLVGGSSFLLKVKPRVGEDNLEMPVTAQQIEQAINVIDGRLNDPEAMIVGQGTDTILVQKPGVTKAESDAIREQLEKVAKLELHEVSRNSGAVGPDGRTLAERVFFEDAREPGYKAYKMPTKDIDGNETFTYILLKSRSALGGSDIARADPDPQRDAVSIVLNGPGTDKMIALTKNMRPGEDRIAILLDDKVMSAPVVQSTPLGKRFEISGLRDPGEPQELARALMNPLENPLEVIDFRSISPTLGSAIIEQGVWAGVVGLGVTALFVLIYYRWAGMIALVGLAVNGIILFGIMAMFEFTFSLPGIAGMILTIGMAVDANVLIYERLREEFESGKSPRNAVAAAYEKAFSAILDGNVTSLITAVILFWLGSSSLQGFATTLTVGILASLFSAILVTRVMFRWALDAKIIKTLKFLNLFKSHNFDFLSKRRLVGSISLVLFLTVGISAVIHRDDAFGIDFTGGTMLEFQLGESDMTDQQVTEALAGIELSRVPYPQLQSNPASGKLLSIRCATEDADAIAAHLREFFPALGATDANGEYLIEASTQSINAVVGSAMLKQSLLALAVGMVGIMIYLSLRFEFAFAFGGFVAIVHDVVITTGLVVLLPGELTMIHVGAILTIAGYSINDTIVIFDRIRETLLTRSGSVREIMNDAINATLSRTILTSSTTIITVVLLSIYGGGSQLRPFSIMITIGLVIGTYSSIFVATPVVLWWSRRKGGDLRRDIMVTEMAAVDGAVTHS